MLPVGFGVAAWFPDRFDGWFLLGSLAATGGLAMLLAQMGRDLGSKKQTALWERWGGAPAVQLLRHRGTKLDRHTLARYHTKMKELVPGVRAPTARTENTNPAAADELYQTWTNYLREATRDHTKFRILYAENISYGFRRNLWGMKPAGMLLAIIGVMAALARVALALWRHDSVPPIAGAAGLAKRDVAGAVAAALQAELDTNSCRRLRRKAVGGLRNSRETRRANRRGTADSENALKLDRLAEIQLGFQFRGKVEPDAAGDFAVIQVKDVKEGHPLQPGHLVRVKLNKAPTAYLVSEGDVLFLSRGHRLFATLIDQPLQCTIAPGYFFIVRVHDAGRILPSYIAWYLNQAAFRQKLRAEHAGTHMPILPMGVFRQLEIPVPPLRTQQAIVAVSDLEKKERALAQQLQDVRKSLIDRVCIDAATGMLKTGNQL